MASSNQCACLAADGLNAFYGQSHVLHDISFSIAEGRSVGLLGRNGMGKSTLIKSCFGLGPILKGKLRVRGQNAVGAPPERIARTGVALVPEGRGVFGSLSVRENLLVAARGQATGTWTLDRVLELFPRLSERLKHTGDKLSGGEQQMLAIGRALMTNPQMLIIDEVTEGLAPLVVKEIWSTVERIRQKGVSFLLVDRGFRSVLQNTDECLILEKGRLVWSGSSAKALASPELLERYLGV